MTAFGQRVDQAREIQSAARCRDCDALDPLAEFGTLCGIGTGHHQDGAGFGQQSCIGRQAPVAVENDPLWRAVIDIGQSHGQSRIVRQHAAYPGQDRAGARTPLLHIGARGD